MSNANEILDKNLFSIVWKGFCKAREKEEKKNDIKIKKLEVKLRTLKGEQDDIIGTLAKLKWRKEVALL